MRDPTEHRSEARFRDLRSRLPEYGTLSVMAVLLSIVGAALTILVALVQLTHFLTPPPPPHGIGEPPGAAEPQPTRQPGDPPPLHEPPVTICRWNAVSESITLCTDLREPVDLGGWILGDGEGLYVIPPGETVARDRDWTVTIRTYNPRGATQRLMLNNRHDQIRLHDPNQNPVDEVSW